MIAAMTIATDGFVVVGMVPYLEFTHTLAGFLVQKQHCKAAEVYALLLQCNMIT